MLSTYLRRLKDCFTSSPAQAGCRPRSVYFEPCAERLETRQVFSTALVGFTSTVKSVTEGGELVFTLQRTGGTEHEVTVNYKLIPGSEVQATANKDFVRPSGSVKFLANGPNTAEIRIQTLEDTVDEADRESFELVITSVRAKGGTGATSASGVVTEAIIFDNDAPPVVSVDSPFKLFGEGQRVPITFTLSAKSEQKVIVPYFHDASFSSTTMNYGSDYYIIAPGNSQAGEIVFQPGQTKRTLNVQIKQDSIVEDDERFVISLGPTTNATHSLFAGTAVDIRDDDLPQFGIVSNFNPIRVIEGDSGFTTVNVTIQLQRQLEVDSAYVVVRTKDGSAVAVEDYQAVNLQIVFFKGGGTTYTLTLNIVADTRKAARKFESFSLEIVSGPTYEYKVGTRKNVTIEVQDDEF